MENLHDVIAAWRNEFSTGPVALEKFRTFVAERADHDELGSLMHAIASKGYVSNGEPARWPTRYVALRESVAAAIAERDFYKGALDGALDGAADVRKQRDELHDELKEAKLECDLLDAALGNHVDELRALRVLRDDARRVVNSWAWVRGNLAAAVRVLARSCK